MRYIKSNHPIDMPPMESITVFVIGSMGVETTMGYRALDDSFIVTGADIMSLYPYRTYGMVIDAPEVNAIEIINKQEIVMHPAAFQAYVEMGIIDSEGNFIEPEFDGNITPEEMGFSSN